MGNTPLYGWPYPELTDPPDGPAQIKAALLAIEPTMKATRDGVPHIQHGQILATITNASGFNVSITFPRAFPVPPTVVGNINSASSTMTGWVFRCTSITNTTFNLYVNGSTAITYTPYLQWIAGIGAATAPAVLTSELPPLEPGWHYATVTCHTPGCPKDDEPVPGCAVPDVPADWGWAGIICGGCGQPITDIVMT
jgi:hypothetical protein